ncbi:MAG TPA: hypothetical protein VFE06_05070 [Acidobacteriaceae bacterium]|jgi:hypothetical protein|nr:hypothetical protein [Acidobacteriaceae bacterium]
MMSTRATLAALVFLSLPSMLFAQVPRPAALPSLPAFPLAQPTNLQIAREVDPSRPFSVVGPHGALLGHQDGSFEAWIFPWKICSHLRITAEMQDYPVPIDVNQYAAWIEVHPNVTILTYSHANFTIRQIMFAPRNAPDGAGAVVLFQIESIRPMTLTFSFTPDMYQMWPAASDPAPSPEWLPTWSSPTAAHSTSGFYILHESFPDHAAALAMPAAEPGILPPYQERPKTWPLQFVLHFDPSRDSSTFFPLLMTMANTRATAEWHALAGSLAALNAAVPSLYSANADYFRDLLATHTSIETPDRRLNDAFSWAIASIDQLRVESPSHDGQAFTAGFISSGDSVRPGFGWFFGRDALWTLYAVDSYGDFPAARQEFNFLLSRQRADGKIMHEYSQTANLVDWQSLPYEYAAADATPLLLMAMNDYLKTSGDLDYVRSHWDNLTRAWNFETTHVSPDGFYNNTQGTGWVENWSPRLPAQEIYLAALDEQASLAFADLARATGHTDPGDQAATRATHLAQNLEQEYFLPAQDFYAFSHNVTGKADDTPTIYPSVAWWDGTFELKHPSAMIQRWASGEFSTDWGTRDIGDHVSFYDPISYHTGTVWPLFTGWVSLAEYRAGHPLAGYAHLMQNADLTWSQDLGDVTELLSGQYFQVLGRSTAHQLWSSAMVISPVLRGLFGLEWNAPANTLTVTPNLPADWNSATVRHIPLGNSAVDLAFTRQGSEWLVTSSGADIHLASHSRQSRIAGNTLHVPIPAVEVAVPASLPAPGSQTEQMKVLDEQRTPHSLTLTLSAPGSSTQTFSLRENLPHLHLTIAHGAAGPELDGLQPVTVQFPAGPGYVTQTVTFSW